VPAPFSLGDVALPNPIISLQLGLALLTVGNDDTKYLVMEIWQHRSFIYTWIAWRSPVVCARLIVQRLTYSNMVYVKHLNTTKSLAYKTA